MDWENEVSSVRKTPYCSQNTGGITTRRRISKAEYDQNGNVSLRSVLGIYDGRIVKKGIRHCWRPAK